MNGPFRPEVTPDQTILSPSEGTITKVLGKISFPDLYDLVHDQGLSYFPRMDAQGNVELFLVFDSIDSFSQSTHAEVYVEFKTYEEKLLAIIWTLNDPRNPLGFPIPFHIPTERDRYLALRLLEQQQTWIHYLAYETDQIVHIYSEAIQFPEDEKTVIEEQIRHLYEGTSPSEEVASLPASTLSPSALLEEGKAYVFDYQKMVTAQGEEEAQLMVMQAVHQAITVMHRHFTSEVRESTFTIWVAEKLPYLYLFVTPSLEELFAKPQDSEEEENPFTRFLSAIPEFVETTDGQPLQAGAYPIMRYEKGKWHHLELDESFQQTLLQLFDQQIDNQVNPYQ
ncbi:hypothetical protein [Brevibacillus sp. SYSU BS000544]|uniref:hypothetical protein n=1 Tax=Brevibacillus sp. SYSU BS000544 TaxID=3416443 RepID=UPI003CE44E9B